MNLEVNFVTNISRNIFFCFQQREETTDTDLEQPNGE